MFVIPQFPLSCNIWRTPVNPPVGPPAVVSICNLAWGRRTAVPSTGGTYTLGVVLMTMTLLLPAGTDIRGDPDQAMAADLVEVPGGTARYYWVAFVDDIGKGFANEHRAAILVQSPPFPVPTP